MHSPQRLLNVTMGCDDLEATAKRVGLLGRCLSHLTVLDELYKVGPVDIEVLISGETGTGKELYANFLHEVSGRSGGFIPVNCGAIQDSLFENEMFGHSVGAYTGANRRSDGLVAAAEGGTLFLDEVHALTPAAQVKLLRLLQEREYRCVGDTRIRIADIRVIAATNQNLRDAIREDRFREDLFHRLNVMSVQIPPLRERSEDIASMLAQFNDRFSECYGLPTIELSKSAWQRLAAYRWPGNVRELENCVRRLICLQPDSVVQPGDLLLPDQESDGHDDDDDAFSTSPVTFFDRPFQEAKQDAVNRFECAYVRSALQRTGGNITHAARLSSKHRRAFFELMRKHNICVDEFKSNGKPR